MFILISLEYTIKYPEAFNSDKGILNDNFDLVLWDIIL